MMQCFWSFWYNWRPLPVCSSYLTYRGAGASAWRATTGVCARWTWTSATPTRASMGPAAWTGWAASPAAASLGSTEPGVRQVLSRTRGRVAVATQGGRGWGVGHLRSMLLRVRSSILLWVIKDFQSGLRCFKKSYCVFLTGLYRSPLVRHWWLTHPRKEDRHKKRQHLR